MSGYSHMQPSVGVSAIAPKHSHLSAFDARTVGPTTIPDDKSSIAPKPPTPRLREHSIHSIAKSGNLLDFTLNAGGSSRDKATPASSPFLELKDRATEIPGQRSPFLMLTQARRE